jgi:hypothetical protein
VRLLVELQIKNKKLKYLQTTYN